MIRTLINVWVCTDCYFAHHYGAHEHEGAWYAGDSDTPANREPLALLVGKGQPGYLFDNTNSETGEGIDEFSRDRCDGCGSSLGGSRYRLSIIHD
jgi:hypothetical protein